MRVLKFPKSGPSVKIRFGFWDFEGYFGVNSKVKMIITFELITVHKMKHDGFLHYPRRCSINTFDNSADVQ